jgi:competence protein ComEA
MRPDITQILSKKDLQVIQMRKKAKIIGILLGALFLGACGKSAAVYEAESFSVAAADEKGTFGSSRAVSATGENLRGRTADDSTGEQGRISGSDPENNKRKEEGGAPDREEQSRKIYVYVCGAVQSPGVYELLPGSRVYQALEAAGGTTETADDRSLNRARLLSDGDQIIVYTREEVQAGQADVFAPVSGEKSDGVQTDGGSKDGRKVNINRAGVEELQELPGIGEARARAIVTYREEHGGFSGIEEIQNISGIKQKAFEKIKDYIEV